MADLGARVTADEIAAEVGADPSHPRIPRLISAYDALVSTYTGNNYVPPAIAKEAVVLVVAYAFDRQVVPGASWAATLRNSGAESLLRPFVGTRGAIVGGQAGQSNGVSTAGPGVDEQARRDIAALREAFQAIPEGRELSVEPTGNPAQVIVLPADFRTYDLIYLNWPDQGGDVEVSLSVDLLPDVDRTYRSGGQGRVNWTPAQRTFTLTGAPGGAEFRPAELYQAGVATDAIDRAARAAAATAQQAATDAGNAADAAGQAVMALAPQVQAATDAAQANTGFLSTFAARVQTVIEAVVPAWARAPEPPAPGGGTVLPEYEQEETSGLLSRAGNLFWRVLNLVPDTPGEASGVGKVLTVTGEGDRDYAFRDLPELMDDTARQGVAANRAAIQGNDREIAANAAGLVAAGRMIDAAAEAARVNAHAIDEEQQRTADLRVVQRVDHAAVVYQAADANAPVRLVVATVDSLVGVAIAAGTAIPDRMANYRGWFATGVPANGFGNNYNTRNVGMFPLIEIIRADTRPPELYRLTVDRGAVAVAAPLNLIYSDTIDDVTRDYYAPFFDLPVVGLITLQSRSAHRTTRYLGQSEVETLAVPHIRPEGIDAAGNTEREYALILSNVNRLRLATARHLVVRFQGQIVHNAAWTVAQGIVDLAISSTVARNLASNLGRSREATVEVEFYTAGTLRPDEFLGMVRTSFGVGHPELVEPAAATPGGGGGSGWAEVASVAQAANTQAIAFTPMQRTAIDTALAAGKAIMVEVAYTSPGRRMYLHQIVVAERGASVPNNGTTYVPFALLVEDTNANTLAAKNWRVCLGRGSGRVNTSIWQFSAVAVASTVKVYAA